MKRRLGQEIDKLVDNAFSDLKRFASMLQPTLALHHRRDIYYPCPYNTSARRWGIALKGVAADMAPLSACGTSKGLTFLERGARSGDDCSGEQSYQDGVELHVGFLLS